MKQKINNIDLSKNPILRRETIKDKMGILDIIAQINNQEYVNIEMQCASQDAIKERILYYWSRTYSKQMKTGSQYDKLNKTIAILIADFNIEGLESLPYSTTWKIIEEKYRKTILTEKLEICIIELPKIANLQNEKDELLDWLFFLVNPESERVRNKMKENKELEEVNEKLEKMSEDEHMQRIAEWRQAAIWEENTARSVGYKNGFDKGLKARNRRAGAKIKLKK